MHVLKRWVAWLWGIRWLMGIAAVVLGLASAWVLFVPIADWLGHHDVGSAKGLLHETAVDNARGRLLTLGAGLAAAGALVFTARNFTLGRRTYELTEQGQVTDRYTKAIEQLGSDKLDVRMGGIYALERVARDSARDHPTVMEVLTAFIREHSREPWPPPDHPASGESDQSTPEEQQRSPRPDVQAAVTVVARRNAERDTQPINLADADLSGADLVRANLYHASLPRADLTGAYLSDANLGGAYLFQANLGRAELTGANLSGADLNGADLTRTYLARADLTHADLSATDLTGADFTRANLCSANLNSAILTRARLTQADLSGADLYADALDGADFSGADLSGALWMPRTKVPTGWQWDADSSRLSTAEANSGSAEAE